MDSVDGVIAVFYVLIASVEVTFCNIRSDVFLRIGTCPVERDSPAPHVIQDIYSTIASAECSLANPADYPPHYNPADGEDFDFIVIGAGSAGSVVANRLTELAEWKVLLIEAGGNPTKTSEVPAFSQYLQKTNLDWQFQTSSEEPNCLGFKGNKCNWPRGKGLGGSSLINYNAYVRGNRKDYDLWEAEGCTGWGYEEVLQYFKKSEDMRATEVLMTPNVLRFHCTGGGLKIENFNTEDSKFIMKVLADGMQELNYPVNLDYNGKFQSGFTFLQGTLEDGRRCSTAKAFLSPVSYRKNLKVSKYSLVTKILVDEQRKIAYGVEFMNSYGKLVKVFAKKEVILSAGAINSPQLLMLSGIGPRNLLTPLNINVLQDLPVGYNLQDHAFSAGLIMTTDFNTKSEEIFEESMIKFLFKKSSKLTPIGAIIGFISTKGSPFNFPDMQIFFQPFAKNDTEALKLYLENLNFKEYIIQQYLELNTRSYTVLLQVNLLNPLSRGKVEIISRNPLRHPKIVAGYFSDPRDFDKFIKAYDFYYDLLETEPFRSIGAQLHFLKIPTCDKLPFLSKEYYNCYLRHVTTTTFHPCGTCKMGSLNSPDSVVDSHLRVKGIGGLRVIDASVMPTIPSGNINAATIMIGEKGSDLIKEDWFWRRELPFW